MLVAVGRSLPSPLVLFSMRARRPSVALVATTVLGECPYRLTCVSQRFVQVGRVCLITHGADEGKLCVIVDVIDSSRALVDGPSTINGVKRQPMLFTRLSLTDIVVKIQRCDASVLVARARRLCPHKHFVVRDLMLAQERAVADAAEGVQGCRCGRQVGQDLRCEEARSAQGPREPHGL